MFDTKLIIWRSNTLWSIVLKIDERHDDFAVTKIWTISFISNFNLCRSRKHGIDNDTKNSSYGRVNPEDAVEFRNVSRLSPAVHFRASEEARRRKSNSNRKIFRIGSCWRAAPHDWLIRACTRIRHTARVYFYGLPGRGGKVTGTRHAVSSSGVNKNTVRQHVPCVLTRWTRRNHVFRVKRRRAEWTRIRTYSKTIRYVSTDIRYRKRREKRGKSVPDVGRRDPRPPLLNPPPQNDRTSRPREIYLARNSLRYDVGTN